MKRIIYLILFCTMLLLGLFCLSSCGEEGATHWYGSYTYTVKDHEVTITGYTGLGSHVTVPDTIRDMPVVAIDGDFGSVLVKELTIPDSIRKIGVLTFMDCTELEKVTLGSGIRDIGLHAFDSEKLIYNEYEGGKYLGNEENPYLALMSVASAEIETFVVHPDTVVVAGGALQSCYRLKEISFPDKVASLSDWALQYCTSLETVHIPASMEFVDSWAFERCDALKNIIVDAENTHYRSIEGSLFSYDGTHMVRYAVGQEVRTYYVPDGVVSIGSRAFERADNLHEVVLPDSLESISGWAFDDCLNLRSVEFGSSLKIIGSQAFLDCVRLLEITLPDSLEEIEYCAFQGCERLKKVTIGTGVTRIGRRTFAGCIALEEVIFLDPTGWKAQPLGWSTDSYDLNLSDPVQNAKYITGEHVGRYWSKTSS